jgi:quercetin dioxygenase-like cupin family protein
MDYFVNMQLYSLKSLSYHQISLREAFIANPNSLEIDSGAIYGYLQSGCGTVWNESTAHLDLYPKMYFSFSGKTGISFDRDAVGFIICSRDEKPFFHVGVLEPGEGRLKYIDGCTDSLLISPVKRGMPCLNHLHFPKGIKQTFHTHPSYRAGIVAYGHGWAETKERIVEINTGDSWYIPKDEVHRFITQDSEMGVIAYHPDSDYGPVDENHPMINRTVI